MARAPSSAIGIDFGQHTVKGIHVQRRGARTFSVNSFASREIGDRESQREHLAHHLKLLLHDLRSSARNYGVAYSGNGSLLKIIEQPPTNIDVLRNALKLNGEALLHEDVKRYVLDCDLVNPAHKTDEHSGKRDLKYLVGGLRRESLEELTEAFGKNRVTLDSVGLAPVALFNAFEFAQPEYFCEEAFILVDIGHRHTDVIGGHRGVLNMMRKINYGGRQLLADLTGGGAINEEAALLLVKEGDAGIRSTAEESLGHVSRELISSIGFCETQWEAPVRRIFFSGGVTQHEIVLQALSDQINMPCEVWDPFGECDIAGGTERETELRENGGRFNVAFGAALDVLKAGPRR